MLGNLGNTNFPAQKVPLLVEIASGIPPIQFYLVSSLLLLLLFLLLFLPFLSAISFLFDTSPCLGERASFPLYILMSRGGMNRRGMIRISGGGGKIIFKITSATVKGRITKRTKHAGPANYLERDCS